MDKKEVLELINAARGAFNLPPLERIPDGVPRNARECPLANALRDIGVVEVWRDVCLVNTIPTAEKLADIWETEFSYEENPDPDAEIVLTGRGLAYMPDPLCDFVWELDNFHETDI